MPAVPAPGLVASPIQPQSSGGPIRVPPLSPEKAMDYRALFQTTEPVNGLLGGLFHNPLAYYNADWGHLQVLKLGISSRKPDCRTMF